MRAALATLVFGSWLLVSACSPAVAPKGPSFDEDLPHERTQASATASAEPATPVAVELPDAPPGTGVRTGKIDRAHLVAVLDGGPAAFLRQVEVAARLDGDHFIGWQLVQVLDRNGTLGGIDIAPGDVLLAVNGKSLAKPDQLHAMWESLRTTNQIVAELARGSAKVELVFDVEPKN